MKKWIKYVPVFVLMMSSVVEGAYPYSATYTPSAGNTIIADHINQSNQDHIDSNIPEDTDDYSVNATEMGTVTDPGDVGSESLATSLSEELERLRNEIYQLKLKWDSTATKWYSNIGAAPVLGTPASGDISNCTGGPTLTSAVLNTGVSGTAVKDDDTMADDSATHICTQQSIKAYVDTEVATNTAMPPGSITAYSGASAPTGWLLCDGTTGKDSVADTTLADLYAVIGTTFGGTGAADFDLPDMRGNFPLGKDNMGGVSRNRVTHANADTVGAEEGTETHILTVAEMPSHTHFVGTTGSLTGGGGENRDGSTDTSSGSAGGGGAHENMPPYLTLNYIISK